MPLFFVLAGLCAIAVGQLQMDCSPTVSAVCKSREATGALSWHHYAHEWVSLGIKVSLLLTGFVVRRAGLPIEVQVRTRGQDLWANAIEEAGRQTGVQFKFGEGPEKERAVFANVAALIADVEEGKLSTTQLVTAGLMELRS